MKTQNSLHWSASCVRYHDAKNGRWTDVAPLPSEIACRIWCAANHVQFVLDRRQPVTAAEALCEVKSGDRAGQTAASAL